jgi:protein-tyrosine phosphatase
MKHVYWVIPGLLAGRPGPDECPWALEELHLGGFRAMLSLCEGIVDRGETRAQGIDHLMLPMSISPCPSGEDASLCRRLVPEALYFLRWHVINALPTLVHCRAGQSCTGLVLACYLATYHGTSPAEAVAKLRAIDPQLLPDQAHETLVAQLLSPASGVPDAMPTSDPST